MSYGVHYTRPYAIRGADNLVRYESAAFALGVLDFTSAETSTVIARGGAVTIVLASSVWPRWDYSTAGTDTITDCLIAGENVDSATDVGFLGVALENVAAGAQGRLAGAGSITAVTCLTAASLTSNVQGNHVIGSSTEGSVDAATTSSTAGRSLGYMQTVVGTSAGQSGSLTQAIVLVSPH